MTISEELEERLAEARETLRKLAPSYDTLLDVTAALYLSSGDIENELDELQRIVKSNNLAFQITTSDRTSEQMKFKLLQLMTEESSNKAAHALLTAASIQKTRQAKESANRRHDKPGGSREKKSAILAAWASGKYRSRDICAEQECAALNMSFASARKALRGTPNPT